MRRFLPPTFIIFFLLITLQLQAATSTDRYITMNLPESVIAEAMKRILPLTLNATSSRLEGTITIINITNFHIKNQRLYCHIDLMGNNLHLVTQIANQEIRLKLGSARVDFDCDALLRYDHTRQTLYIRPTARGIHGTEALSRGDISQALLLFLNGQEFPLTLQNLRPIVAEASNKIITITTNIIDIRAVEGALQLSLAPTVIASPRQGSAATVQQ